MNRARSWIVALVILGVAAPARADQVPLEPDEYDLAPLVEPLPQLNVDWKLDAPITAVSLALWSGLGFAKASLAPATCHWCISPRLDFDVRKAVVSTNPGVASRNSTMLMWAIPAGALAYDILASRAAGDGSAVFDDVLVITEAIAITGVLTQGVKYLTGRERPYAQGSTLSRNNSNAVLSFWSGHTSTAFSAAAAAGMVAQLRRYPGWQWVYAIGLTAAAGTGYLRMAGDQHWLTDVVAGAAAGTAVGVLVPWLHRDRGWRWQPQLAVSTRGVALGGKF